MKQVGIYRFVAIRVICAMLLTTGCAQTATIYRVTMGTGKSVQWEGGAGKPRGFKGGHTGNKMEMTFLRQIQSIDGQGNATAKITIRALKYMVTIKSNVALDFDSLREEDLSNPLSKLIGQSYTIEITPSGEVSRVTDTSDALAAVKGDSAANNVAVKLLSADAIKEQHTVPALPAASENQLRKGGNWSSLKKVSFDLMGAKLYERVYTIEKIEDSLFAAFMRILSKNRKYHRIAIVQMDAFPSAEGAKQLHKEQTVESFSKMFDNTETYTGELRMDLTEDRVEKYREELLVEWFIVNPSPKDDEPPSALRMAATRIYSIERID